MVINQPQKKKGIRNEGVWNIYYRGVKVDELNGDVKPLFQGENAQKTIEKYEKIYQEKYAE